MKKTLLLYYISEVIGYVSLKLVAITVFGKNKKYKFSLLVNIEVKMKHKVILTLQDNHTSIPLKITIFSNLLGLIAGITMIFLSWKNKLKLIKLGTEYFIPKIKENEAVIAANELSLYQLFLEHETAINKFVNSELSNKTNSELPLLNILEKLK